MFKLWQEWIMEASTCRRRAEQSLSCHYRGPRNHPFLALENTSEAEVDCGAQCRGKDTDSRDLREALLLFYYFDSYSSWFWIFLFFFSVVVVVLLLSLFKILGRVFKKSFYFFYIFLLVAWLSALSWGIFGSFLFVGFL